MIPVPPFLARLSDYLFYWAERRPTQTAFTLGETRWTYADAADCVRALSRAMLDAGIRKGDRIAMLSTPRPEFLLTLLAATDIGAVWAGLNPRYRLDEMRYIVQDCAPRLFFSITAFENRDYASDVYALIGECGIEKLVTVGGAWESAETFNAFCAHGKAMDDTARIAARDAVTTDDAALIVYTSGTTGKPKGALLKHYSFVYCFHTELLKMQVEPVIDICNLPINHVGCVGDLCALPLIAGGTIHFMERADPAAMLEVIERERVTLIGGIPTLLQFLAAAPRFADADLSSLQMIAWGGAPMPLALLKTYRQRVNAHLMAMYGMTEATGSITLTDLDAADEILAHTLGKPDPQLNVRLMNDDGKVCGVGEAGEIQFKHASVMLGYYNRPDATRAAFTDDGYFRTGDIAVQRADGNLELVGRKQDRYKSGGYNVYPREIEMCLESHPAVALAAVIAVSDAVYHQVGHAFVLPQAGAQVDAPELDAWCRARLANYKIPKKIYIQEQLPLLPVGKIDKHALRQKYDLEHQT
jgi:acyl-CoA synthetase (AMP-forming)/AMP-acid ligase II